jgi:hypothetical protein
MQPSKRQPSIANWGIAATDETGSKTARFVEPGMEEKLEMLRKNWASRTPDKEFSLTLGTGTLVYVGRYPQGVVLKLNDNADQVTYITNEMAAKLGLILREEA